MSSRRQLVHQAIRERIAALPQTPGVYLFLDAHGSVLYVGKAKCLRRRVASYFQPSAKLAQSRGRHIDNMIRHLVADLDFVRCETELDAIFRESRLIYDIQPPYNLAAKDNRSYTYMEITTDETFPRVRATREPKTSGVRLYGPFISGRELLSAMPLLQRAFAFRMCEKDIDADSPAGTPCLLQGIHQCTAPCAGLVSPGQYKTQIARLRRFVESQGRALKAQTKRTMLQAAKAMNFERAAQLRDQLATLENLRFKRPVRTYLPPEDVVPQAKLALERLAGALGIGHPSPVIEALAAATCDDGAFGAVVCIANGRPFKSAYRRYRLDAEGPPFSQVVNRRYHIAGQGLEPYPDVIMLVSASEEETAMARNIMAGFRCKPTRVLTSNQIDDIAGQPAARRLLKTACKMANTLAKDGF